MVAASTLFVFVVVGAAATPPGEAGKAKGQEATSQEAKGQEEGVIDPRANDALKKMGATLGRQQTFTVDATTVDEFVTTEGQKIQQVKESQVLVDRPRGMRVDRVGPHGPVAFYYDTKSFTLFAEKPGLYATAAAPPKFDAALDEARDKLGIEAPAGDLMVADPYRALIDGVQVGRYVGLEPVGGEMAHHLAMSEKDVDWEIWIREGEEALPLRYVITTKNMASRPQFTAELDNWKLQASVPKGSFTFTPPADAKRVEFDALKAPQP